jgi:hypothetical protein
LKEKFSGFSAGSVAYEPLAPSKPQAADSAVIAKIAARG